MKYKYNKELFYPAVFILEAIKDKDIYDSAPWCGYSLLDPVIEWLEKTYGPQGKRWKEELMCGELQFKTRKDATLFKMVWYKGKQL